MPGLAVYAQKQFEVDNSWYLGERDDAELLGKYFDDTLDDERWKSSIAWARQLAEFLLSGNAQPTAGATNEHFHPQTSPGSQGARTTCTSFALVAAMEGVIRRCHPEANFTIDLSEQYAHYHLMIAEGNKACDDCGIALWRGAEILQKVKICTDTNWPYLRAIPQDPNQCLPLATANTNARYRIGHSFIVPGPKESAETYLVDINLLKILIDKGLDVALSLVNALGVDWVEYPTVNVQYADQDSIVRAHANPNRARQIGHTVLVIAHGIMEDGMPYFICKNSRKIRGVTTPEGYVYMSENYVRAYARYALVVTSVYDDETLCAPEWDFPVGTAIGDAYKKVVQAAPKRLK